MFPLPNWWLVQMVMPTRRFEERLELWRFVGNLNWRKSNFIKFYKLKKTMLTLAERVWDGWRRVACQDFRLILNLTVIQEVCGPPPQLTIRLGYRWGTNYGPFEMALFGEQLRTVNGRPWTCSEDPLANSLLYRTGKQFVEVMFCCDDYQFWRVT